MSENTENPFEHLIVKVESDDFNNCSDENDFLDNQFVEKRKCGLFSILSNLKLQNKGEKHLKASLIIIPKTRLSETHKLNCPFYLFLYGTS